MTAEIEPKGSAKRYTLTWSSDCGSLVMVENANGEYRLDSDYESLERELAALQGASRMTEERAREIALEHNTGEMQMLYPYGFDLWVHAILAACREDSAALVEENTKLRENWDKTERVMNLVANSRDALRDQVAALVERNKALEGEQVGRFYCSECGPGVKGDEDGCCVMCGRDCATDELRWVRTYTPPEYGQDEDDAAARAAVEEG